MAKESESKTILKAFIIPCLIWGGIIFFCYYQCTADDRERDKREKEEINREVDIQQAINDADFIKARKRASELDDWCGDRDKAYEKITRAQVAFLINSGSVEQAYNIALEENKADIFFSAFMPALSDIYEKVGKMKTLQYLTKVELGYTPDLSEQYVGYENEPYNDSAIKYNTILEQFMVYIDILGDKEFATQLLRLVKPIVVELPKRGGKGTGVKLSTQPQEDIKKKLNL